MSEPLTTLMAGGPMPVAEAVRIIRDAAAALRDVHGELWPSAISVADDGVGILPPGTFDRSRYGQYAAPERILGKPAVPESDVFSLGAILFHALAGRPAFRGDSAAEVMLSACLGGALDVRELRRDVSAEVARVVERALAKEPARRFATPALLAHALDAALAHGAFAGRRMLVADDEAPVRDLYSHIAARIGVEVDLVATGRDAIAAMKSRRYDVALLDLNMPRLSGWEVLDFLRTRDEARPERLFIVTGFAGQNISEADRALVAAVLYKPVSPDELRKLVTACLSGGPVDVDSILRTTGHRLLPVA